MKQTYDLVKDASYFRGVLRNMRMNGLRECRVQFGETGKGVSPNYMIIDKDGNKYIYRGVNHEAYKSFSIEEFSENNLSHPLTFKEVQEEISKRL